MWKKELVRELMDDKDKNVGKSRKRRRKTSSLKYSRSA